MLELDVLVVVAVNLLRGATVVEPVAVAVGIVEPAFDAGAAAASETVVFAAVVVAVAAGAAVASEKPQMVQELCPPEDLEVSWLPSGLASVGVQSADLRPEVAFLLAGQN